MKRFGLIAAMMAMTSMAQTQEIDSLQIVELPDVTISSVKAVLNYGNIASPVSRLSNADILRKGVKTPKQLSSVVPNLHIPEYGSSITSTIYMRGFGSRIDNPVLGMYVDDVPIIDKNNYDFDFFDVRSVDVVRGPQSTLYGRNSMLGVMSVTTQGPSDTEGGRANVEYGKDNWISARMAYYQKHFSISAGYRHFGGVYTNLYTNEKCDNSDALSFKTKYKADLSENFSLENSLSSSLLKQGGYAYRQYVDDYLHHVDYNDTCQYKRFNLIDGLKLKLKTPCFSLSSVSSVQWLIDRMFLDNDFTSRDMFTMEQQQHQYALTEEIILRPERHPSWWNSQTGMFFMYKHNKMEAPVHIKQDAIDEIVLGSVNSLLPSPMRLAFSENDLLVNDLFFLNTFDAALFHESYFKTGRWLLTAGLRFDYERNAMEYDCGTSVHYMFLPFLPTPKQVDSTQKGEIHHGYVQLLPKASILYDASPKDDPRQTLKLSATVSKGFKAGGYNTQIFSDMLQSQLKTDMMTDAGRQVEADEDMTPEHTTYKPETCANFELGARYRFQANDHSELNLNGSAFLVSSNNLQLTIMPEGKKTGRMMTNAGQAQSLGFEFDGSYRTGNYTFTAAYGYTYAFFRHYRDGEENYESNRIPYSPESTMALRASRLWNIRGYVIQIGAEANRVGKIWWNESNTLHQDPYGIINADISISKDFYTIYARFNNIFAKSYKTFYFKSVGNEFYQKGRPFQWQVGCNINL